MFGVGGITLHWENHHQTQYTNLNSLWESGEFLDVTIACDDDQIRAHKVILSAASPFFRKLLLQNPHNHPLLYLRGTAKKDVLALLQFIYSGETQIIKEDLETFMDLANSLQIQGLVEEFSVLRGGHEADSTDTVHVNQLVAEEPVLETHNVHLVKRMIIEKMLKK